uniref:Uncharacterized protein n=1 Tax=Cacopsylla melanoneura TaxID=428564 RepID=A0A8D8TDH8_9HEMI
MTTPPGLFELVPATGAPVEPSGAVVVVSTGAAVVSSLLARFRNMVLSRLTTFPSYSSAESAVMLGCEAALGLTPETLLGSSSTAFTTHTISSRQSRSLPMLTPPGTN